LSPKVDTRIDSIQR